MGYEIREEDSSTIIVLSGEVDLESSPQVRSVLLEHVGKKRAVLVDMSAISYIDSSGIASLVEAYQSARRGGTMFALVAVSDAARRVLELARLDQVFSIHESVTEALADGG
ncbi:MAG: anti-sigma factor antagonist [Gammaproteobacteria bacterium]|nr:anti-sigma factor antagonist [Gammaproteobacteria bacterium]NIM73195.1 anti-sigma factor antagonist [Gammaproteobacteria bacterium]NIN40031.1 anti-sigma factor antagonist [Gammaproteobacteria bacterium]NIO26245.1 anti-sigma factor antagonist [Gammaproteobacteria bacterium]NIO66054.1 anti-sigma factor antagonist [Gammaproteobacteria bacterium]